MTGGSESDFYLFLMTTVYRQFHGNRVTMTDFSFLNVCQTKTNDCKVKQTIQLYAQGLLLTISTDIFTKPHLLSSSKTVRTFIYITLQGSTDQAPW
jgi:hypothetical protein